MPAKQRIEADMQPEAQALEDPYEAERRNASFVSDALKKAVADFNSAVDILNPAHNAIEDGYRGLQKVEMNARTIRANLGLLELQEKGLAICTDASHESPREAKKPDQDELEYLGVFPMVKLGAYATSDRNTSIGDSGPVTEPTTHQLLCQEHFPETFNPDYVKREMISQDELIKTQVIILEKYWGSKIMDILEIPAFHLDPEQAELKRAADPEGITYSRPLSPIEVRRLKNQGKI